MKDKRTDKERAGKVLLVVLEKETEAFGTCFFFCVSLFSTKGLITTDKTSFLPFSLSLSVASLQVE